MKRENDDALCETILEIARRVMPAREFKAFRSFLSGQRVRQPDLFIADDEMRLQRMSRPRSKMARRRLPIDAATVRPKRKIHSWRRARK